MNQKSKKDQNKIEKPNNKKLKNALRSNLSRRKQTDDNQTQKTSS